MEKLFGDLPDNEFIQKHLYNEKYIINLSELIGRISDKCNLRYPEDGSKSYEPTFAYLLPLLQEGKIKMRISDPYYRKIQQTDIYGEKVKWYSHLKIGVDEIRDHQNVSEYTGFHQAKEAIERLRITINRLIPDFYDSVKFEDMTPDQRSKLKELTDFEEFGVEITLTENEWPWPLPVQNPTQDDG